MTEVQPASPGKTCYRLSRHLPQTSMTMVVSPPPWVLAIASSFCHTWSHCSLIHRASRDRVRNTATHLGHLCGGRPC